LDSCLFFQTGDLEFLPVVLSLEISPV